MAQEVHDGVGHGLAVIAMQAGVALHVLDRDPARARELLGHPSQPPAGRRWTGCAPSCSGSAPAGEADPPRARRPGWPTCRCCWTGCAPAGCVLSVTGSTRAAGVPPDVGAAAYRIVQEALTNVLRHAGDTAAWVSVSRLPTGSLVVEVARPAAAARRGGEAGRAGHRRHAASGPPRSAARSAGPRRGRVRGARGAAAADRRSRRRDPGRRRRRPGPGPDGAAGAARRPSRTSSWSARPPTAGPGWPLVRADAARRRADGRPDARCSTASRRCAEITADPALAAVRVVVLTTFELDEYVFEALRGRGQRLRAQGRRPGRAAARGAGGRRRRLAAVADGDPPGDRALRRRTAPAARPRTRGSPSSPSGSGRSSPGSRPGGPTTRSPPRWWSARPPCARTSAGRCSSCTPATAPSWWSSRSSPGCDMAILRIAPLPGAVPDLS